MEYYLVKPADPDEAAVAGMMEKWRAFGGRMNPGLLREYAGDYAGWLCRLDEWDRGENTGGEVPQTLYLMKDSGGAVLGATALRHYLDHTNIVDGGHVAYGIAPEYRGRGLGRAILGLALAKLKEMGIYRVLVTCDADNEPSRRVILGNGGVLENQTYDEDGVLIERYWIDNA